MRYVPRYKGYRDGGSDVTGKRLSQQTAHSGFHGVEFAKGIASRVT